MPVPNFQNGKSKLPAMPGGLPLARISPMKMAMPEIPFTDPPSFWQKFTESGLYSFLRGLFGGSGKEQKADMSTLQAARTFLDKQKKQANPTGKMRMPDFPGNPAGGGVVPGLFAALDAPLHGLTPDDIVYANEVDAALARRPRFTVRMLSVTVALMFLVLLLWAAFAEVDEVTHADGSVVGSQRTQTIQNLEGGILRTIFVHEGEIVDKGTVLAQLDNEMAESAYRDSINKVMENTLAIDRLEAELKGDKPHFPKDIDSWVTQVVEHLPDEKIMERAQQIVIDQENAWQSRTSQLQTEIDVLTSQYEQRRREVQEQSAHKAQLDRSLALAIQQRDAAYALVKKNNFSRMEFLRLEQNVVELQGQINVLAASIPKSQAAAEEAKQRIASRKAEQRTNIADEINKRRLELTTLRETVSAGGDRVIRTELRAPMRGTVKQIYINSVGGVVKPGESIMDIVPLDDTLLVEARVRPQDVAFLHAGQSAIVKISAYDFNIYGGLDGKLESISADTLEDKKGEYYYLVKIRTPKTSIVYRNEALPIIPGMMVTVDIMIGKKTVLDYLLKPILKAKQNALRER